MTQQEYIDQNIRMLLGDLQMTIVVLRGRIVELEALTPSTKLNGDRPNPPAPQQQEERFTADA